MSNTLTAEQAYQIVMDEYRYWYGVDSPDNPDVGLMSLGAMGATANVVAALIGHPAPWHYSHPLHAQRFPKAATPLGPGPLHTEEHTPL